MATFFFSSAIIMTDFLRKVIFFVSDKAKTIWKRVIVAVILVISLIMIFNQPIKRWLVSTWHPQVSQSEMAKNDKKKGTYDYKGVKELTLANIAAARAHNNLQVIGVISAPEIGMNLPISKGITNSNLALSAGTFRPNMKMGQGNYALAGHNMSNLGPNVLFSPLYYKAKPGQYIYVTNLKKVYQYQITQRKFISKYDVGVVNDTPQPIITLVTCDATGANRLMIRGNLVKTMNYKNAPHSVQQAISSKYNQ